MEVYVLIKVLKYCTGSSATSYKVKFAVQQVFMNKGIESMDELGAAIKEIIHYSTIRGKFSSVHPDLVAEGITRVEVSKEGLQFIADKGGSSVKGGISANLKTKAHVMFQTSRRRRVIAGKSALSFNGE